MIIVHSENSTATPEWHPNAVQRGTWAIYQSCIITIFLCVWTTIHLNIPRPNEKKSKQVWRRIGWSLLTIIAPEVVALNAWLQYRGAKSLLKVVNWTRPPKQKFYRHCLNAVAFACFAPIRFLDWLRISRFGHLLVRLGLVQDRTSAECESERRFAQESDLRREARVQATMEDAKLTWTMSMAFFAYCGGCAYRGKAGKNLILHPHTIADMALYDPISLLPVQRLVLQNPGKASAIAKTITCVQAFWFCSQCIARLSDGLAVSLLELNTFAHCISTLLIYIFWWDKPYDAESHIFIESRSLDLHFLMSTHSLPPPAWVCETRQMEIGPLTIADAKGNPLMYATCYRLSSISTRVPLPIDPDTSMQLRMKLPNTGLYSTVDSTDAEVSWYLSEDGLLSWQRFWKAWVAMDCPLPKSPLVLHWLSTFAVRDHNLDDRLRGAGWTNLGVEMALIMTMTFAAYGGLHLLAWRYKFNSTAERCLWQIGSVTTASSGLTLLAWYLVNILNDCPPRLERNGVSRWRYNYKLTIRFVCHAMLSILALLAYILILLNIASRAFLFVESFIALPNSPRSTYAIPSWTAYIPHI